MLYHIDDNDSDMDELAGLQALGKAAMSAAVAEGFAFENDLHEAVGEENPNRMVGLGSADETGVLDRAGRNGILMSEYGASEEQVDYPQV
jgi:hypothetical protein